MKSLKYAKKPDNFLKRTVPRWVDLHIHSIFSDGEYDVKSIIEMAEHKHLSAIAITDHDTIDAFHEGKELAQNAGIELIPGVELSSFYDGSEIHILGYLFDPNNLSLNMKLLDLQKKRKTRAEKIVEKLRTVGVCINMERVYEKARGTSIGRPHIASVMLDEEYISSFHDAFDKYLSTDFIREFETEKITPEESIQLIIQAGGTAVLAHPAQTLRDDLIEHLAAKGLGGIETYSNGIDKSTISRYRALAKELKLICTGGSDFHADRTGGKSGIGSVKTPYSALRALKKSANLPDE